jgi:hypothetical protein
MTYNDAHSLELLRATAGGLPYKPATYTCITEFTDNFPKKKTVEFSQEYFPAAESAWQPESPYPRIYTKHYRKSILLTLKQTIGKT